MKIIVTGFGAFSTNNANPTKEVINKLPRKIKEIDVYPIELPVIFDKCFDVLKSHIDTIKPDVIIMLGLAGKRKNITPERIAINLKDTTISDNEGNKPVDKIISKNGKSSYFSTLPIRKIENLLKSKNIPVSISNTAGLYVCNNIMYHVLHYIEKEKLDCKAGFVHVPYMEEDKPNDQVFSLPLETIYQAVLCMLEGDLYETEI